MASLQEMEYLAMSRIPSSGTRAKFSSLQQNDAPWWIFTFQQLIRRECTGQLSHQVLVETGEPLDGKKG